MCVELRDDSVEMTKVYVQAVPVHQGQDAMLRRGYNYYSKFAWSDQRIAGMVDSDRLKHLQDIYYDRHIVAKKSPIDDLYTNRFIGAGGKGFGRRGDMYDLLVCESR